MKLRVPLGFYSPGMGPPKPDIYLGIFYYFQLSISTPPKNSGPNPMSFQFLTRGRLTQVLHLPPNLKTLATPKIIMIVNY